MKIVERSLNRQSRGKRDRSSLMITSAQGKRVKAERLNVDSPSFGDDLLDSFARTVTRVRRENKAMFGRQDGLKNDDER